MSTSHCLNTDCCVATHVPSQAATAGPLTVLLSSRDPGHEYAYPLSEERRGSPSCRNLISNICTGLVAQNLDSTHYTNCRSLPCTALTLIATRPRHQRFDR